MKRQVIIDCDPGHDDAIALLLAFSSDKLDIKAVTVTAGNQTILKTLYNAMRVITCAGGRTRVARGAERPLFRELITAPSVHGESGLDGPELPDPDFTEEKISAVELMRDVLLASNRKVTIVATAPLTNVAALLMTYPELKERVDMISLMGGAIYGGNWTAAAEFNILVDPEAADIVFRSGIPIVMCGLDVTHKALIYPNEVEIIRKLGGKIAVLIAELIDFFMKFHLSSGFTGAPIHDACAIAYLIAPELFRTKDYHIDIETRGKFTLGATVADLTGMGIGDKNVKVCMDIDRQGFLDLLIGSVQVYAEREGF